MTDSQAPFFIAVDRADGSLEINFLTKSVVANVPGGKSSNSRVNILPGRYGEILALGDRFRGRVVVATGRGPVEGYFAVGYYASLFGAKEIVYEGANATPRIVMPAGSSAPVDKPWIAVERQGGGITVTLAGSSDPSGKWNDAEIGYASPALLPQTSQLVTFTGRGAVSMYLLLGVSAARACLNNVCVSKPAIPYAIRFTPVSAGETHAVIGAKTGVVVGIIGDPNSGKSVFSRTFYTALRSSMPKWFRTWIYDCDLASPTPDWYCSALVDADPIAVEDYKALRESQKVGWNADMEKRCADELGILRTNLDLVIADLPGGRHKDANKQPLEHPLRIPGVSRAEMFRQCDAFILICRKDRRDIILKGWYDDLAKYGLEDRVAAIIDSAEPDEEFSVSPFSIGDDGIVYGEMRGLKREHLTGETSRRLVEPIRPLVRALAAIPVVNAARAATATAFLTGDKGTRYGAAVRSASSGRIFAAGQYSSFNHSTNLHAEMNALSQAAIAGEPDVDILAITSTASSEASPCGVCRQVILEHAIRTGRDFDVALTTPGRLPVFLTASQLLPHAWRADFGDACDDLREFRDVKSVFSERTAPLIGSEFMAPPVCSGDPDRMGLVWDDAFAPGTILFKYKYEQTASGSWRKLPHAFTESAAYVRYLVDRRCGSDTFSGLAKFRLPAGNVAHGSAGVAFKHPVPLPTDMRDLLDQAIFGPLGLDVTAMVTVTGSRMTGLSTTASDWDLCVAATPEKVVSIRGRVVELAAEGRVTFPDKSRSWKLLKSVFPGATADGGRRIHAERRYAESFRLDDIPISFLFVSPASATRGFAFPVPFTSEGRAVISGKVVDASFAPYKRSESVVETDDHRRVRLLCYYKTANLLKNGDRIAAAGVRCLHPDGEILGCAETLVLSAPAVDKLVWLP